MIVTKAMEEIDAYMTPERMRMERERAKNIPIRYDEDCPPTTPEMAKTYHRVDFSDY